MKSKGIRCREELEVAVGGFLLGCHFHRLFRIAALGDPAAGAGRDKYHSRRSPDALEEFPSVDVQSSILVHLRCRMVRHHTVASGAAVYF